MTQTIRTTPQLRFARPIPVCVRYIQWQPKDADEIVKLLNKHCKKQERPAYFSHYGALLYAYQVGRADAIRMSRELRYQPGDWIIIPQDYQAPIERLAADGFDRKYQDATLKS